ncbi:ribosome maturation factor RimM [Paracraurococcus lichenis]|uniref:Ribosome maturation factor RimM n=1 Tax=Paracraurococcus lichenis TaxID=3064888 RepID=A0ABT9DZD8_9PROT|nr:ribosome maturation factor RimM [Paracraurococcus sp. LOR1-02]MDO9709110.1 ribosome maturation factor RimM [Paracraurococcus sp. LOR1-02]
MAGKRILVGEIGRPHGVRGLVKLRSFTADPAAIASYGPLTDESGTRRVALTLLADGLARVEGVADRDAAQRLTGTKLYVERDRLPPPEEEEYYLADLIGLRAETEAGQGLGLVRDVEEHGAGAFLVLEGPPERLLPFTRAVVPVVDIAGGRLVVSLPEEVTVPPQPGEEDAA